MELNERNEHKACIFNVRNCYFHLPWFQSLCKPFKSIFPPRIQTLCSKYTKSVSLFLNRYCNSIVFFFFFEIHKPHYYTNFTNNKKANQLETRILVYFPNTIAVRLFLFSAICGRLFVCLFVHYEMVSVISATSIIIVLHLQVVRSQSIFILSFWAC